MTQTTQQNGSVQTFSLKEISEELGLTTDQVYVYLSPKSGLFVGGTKNGRSWIFTQDDIDTFRSALNRQLLNKNANEVQEKKEEEELVIPRDSSPIEEEPVTLSSTIPLLIQEMHLTTPTPSVSIVPASTMIDHIKQAISLLQESQSIQEKHERLLHGLKRLRERQAECLGDLDTLIHLLQ
jgi:hypothetical protein